MKIDSTSIGNYNPAYVRSVAARRAAEAKPANTENISVEEKKFFANLYPAQKEQVMNYQFYNAKGKVTGTQLGSLFDRRG